VLFADEPIESIGQDTLDRNTFVTQLQLGLTRWDAAQPLVVGLYGEWGQGKTSVLNLVSSALAANPRLVIATYNPWDFNSTENLVQGFLSAIEAALSEKLDLGRIADVKSLFQRIRSAVSTVEVSTTGAKATFNASRLLGSDKTVEQLVSSASEFLSQADVRIIVFVDDLDRLTADDLLTTLKLVRLAKNLGRITYVLSMDNKRASQLLENDARVPPQFLEKIISVDISLPPVQRRHIDKLVDTGINTIINESGIAIESDFEQRLGGGYRDGLVHEINTLRDAKRYLNAVAFTLPLVRGEVNYADFFLLEAVRVFSPVAYDLLYQRRRSIASFDGYGIFDNDRTREERWQALDEMMSRVPESQAPMVRSVLSKVFPQVEAYFHHRNMVFASSAIGGSWRREQRACHPGYVERYFLFAIDEDDVPDATIRAFIANVNETSARPPVDLLRDELERLGADRRTQFVNKLRVFGDDIAEGRRLEFAFSVAANSSLLLSESAGFSWSGVGQAEGLIFELLGHVTETNQRTTTMCGLAQASTSTYLAVDLLVDSLRTEPSSARDLPPVDEGAVNDCLRNILEQRLVSSGENVFQSEGRAGIRILYVWAHTLEERSAVTEYLLRQMRQDSCILGRFCSAYISPGFPGERPGFRLRELAETADPERLYRAAVDGLESMSECDASLLEAVQLFIDSYRERTNTSNGEASGPELVAQDGSDGSMHNGDDHPSMAK
jgi:predicted KAP-like P-loop ATPase